MKEKKNKQPGFLLKEVIDLSEFCKNNPNSGFGQEEVEICDKKLLSEIIEHDSRRTRVWKPLGKKK